eukprot:3292049-Pyramimonas_sp.AAC.1
MALTLGVRTIEVVTVTVVGASTGCTVPIAPISTAFRTPISIITAFSVARRGRCSPATVIVATIVVAVAGINPPRAFPNR